MKCGVKLGAFVVLLIVLSYLFYKHSGFFQFSHNPMQYMPNMYRTPALIPQRGYSFFENHSGARTPPEGTLARSQKIYPYSKATLAAEIPRYSNPLPADRATLLRGQKVFMTYCVVCHGSHGLGDGYIVPPFPPPPSLQSDKIRSYADSQIFHVITAGQNLMSSYAPQIREEDRWAVVHYVKALHRADHPSDEDLKAFDELLKSPKGGP